MPHTMTKTIDEDPLAILVPREHTDEGGCGIPYYDEEFDVAQGPRLDWNLADLLQVSGRVSAQPCRQRAKQAPFLSAPALRFYASHGQICAFLLAC